MSQGFLGKPYSYEATTYFNGDTYGIPPVRMYYSLKQSMFRKDIPPLSDDQKHYITSLQGEVGNGAPISVQYATDGNTNACAAYCTNGTVCPCATSCNPTSNDLLSGVNTCSTSLYENGDIFAILRLLAEVSKDNVVSANCSQMGGHYYFYEKVNSNYLEICISEEYAPVYQTLVLVDSRFVFNVTIATDKFSYDEPNPSVFAVPSYCGCGSNGRDGRKLSLARKYGSHLPRHIMKAYEQMAGFKTVKLK